jgi:hypothetical protein
MDERGRDGGKGVVCERVVKTYVDGRRVVVSVESRVDREVIPGAGAGVGRGSDIFDLVVLVGEVDPRILCIGGMWPMSLHPSVSLRARYLWPLELANQGQRLVCAGA